MEGPLEVSIKNIEKSDELEDILNREVEKLNRFSPDIISCRVALEKEHKQNTQGSPFHVRVEVSLPRKKRLATTSSAVYLREESLFEIRKAIRDAFGAMEKRLKKTESKKKHQVKSPAEPRAFVAKLFSDQGYGFLKRDDTGEEIYFHQNSVLNNDFERLTVGTEARYDLEMGEKGPQASSVQIVGKLGSRMSEEEEQQDVFLNE
jgi:ribosomal subunit interface protein